MTDAQEENARPPACPPGIGSARLPGRPPALGSTYSGVLGLDSFAPTCRARVRKEAGSYSYDYSSYSSDAE